MQKLFMSLFDIFFPPSDDMLLVRALTIEDVRSLSREQNHNGIISLSNFQNENMRALVHEAKFHGSKKAFTLLAVLLDSYLKNHKDYFDIVMPIPLSPKRKRERGFNQIEEVLHESKFRRTVVVKARTLHRIKNTPPQTSLEKHERLTNMKDVFRIKKPGQVAKKRILLLDDVSTTGATLREAKKELLMHDPASVTMLALAH